MSRQFCPEAVDGSFGIGIIALLAFSDQFIMRGKQTDTRSHPRYPVFGIAVLAGFREGGSTQQLEPFIDCLVVPRACILVLEGQVQFADHLVFIGENGFKLILNFNRLRLAFFGHIEQRRHKLADVRPHVDEQLRKRFRRQAFALVLPVSFEPAEQCGIMLFHG